MKQLDKQSMIDNINYVAERTRNTQTTVGMFQVYQEKFDEAIDYAADGYPDSVSKYPLIEVEAKVMGIKPATVAKRIIKKKKEWIALITNIERIRLKGIKDINKTTTTKKSNTLYESIINQLQSIE